MLNLRALAAASAAALAAVTIGPAPTAAHAEGDPPTVVVVTGTNQQVYYHLTGTSTFTGLGGATTYTPSVMVTPSNTVYVLVTGTDNHLYVRTTGSAWQRVDSASAYCGPSAMAMTGASGNSITAVVGCRGRDGALHTSTSTFSDGGYPSWTTLTSWGGQISDGPAIAVPTGGGTPTFFVTGINRPPASNVYAKSSPTGAWSQVGSYSCASRPAVSVTGASTQLACLLDTGAPMYAVNNGAGWPAPAVLSGRLLHAPAIVRSTSGTTSLYAEGGDGALWERSGLPGGTWLRKGGALLSGAAAASLLAAPPPGTTTTIRINSETGGDPNGQSSRDVISPDGTAIGFYSIATNFTDRPEYGAYDVFETILATRTTRLVSYAYDGGAANGLSTYPAVSNNGTFVAFMSRATNILPNDDNPGNDIFVRNMDTGVVKLVSVARNGGFGGGTRPTISADGRYIAFNASGSRIAGSPVHNGNNVYVRDMVAGTTKLVTGMGNGESIRSMISPDGSTVTFMSEATNLDPTVGRTDSGYDVYQANLATGAIRLVSATPANDEAGSGAGSDNDSRAAVSASGRFVVFESTSSDLISGDTNGAFDIYERDMSLAPGAPGAMKRISVRPNGSQTQGASTRPTVNGDGNLVAYATNDNLVVPNDTNATRDVVLRNVSAGTNTAISVTPTGTVGGCPGGSSGAVQQIRPGASCISSRPQIDMAGDRLLFVSGFTNLVPNDNNGLDDIFVRFL